MLAALPTDPAALHPHPETRRAVRAFGRRADGAAMVEYALMLALVAIVALAAVGSTGRGARDVFTAASEALGAAAGGGGGNGGGNGEGGGNGGCGTQCGQ